MRLCLDTNVWLSGSLFSGVCETLLLEAADRELLQSSELIRYEAHGVLRRKFPQVADACERFDRLWQEELSVADAEEPQANNDLRLVHTAVAAKADLFATGDARILTLGEAHAPLKILSPRDAYIEVFTPHLKRVSS